MKNPFNFVLLLALSLTLEMSARAEIHHATHLGNPATRFAPTMQTPDDLRARFQNKDLLPDFAEVLRQWGWQGNLNDFFAAGLTNEITEIFIPVGSVMPFMSTRENGLPLCLRNVHWEGKEPIDAYAFTFISNGEIYRCVIPKPCSNFFLEDLGPEPRHALAIDCSVPDTLLMGSKLDACLNIRNLGNVPEQNTTVSLPIPENSSVLATSDGGSIVNNTVQWQISSLPVNATKEVCTQFKTRQPGVLNFNSTASSATAASVNSSCETTVRGIPAILLEKSDNPDPVSIGTTTTYTVKVTNQGTADDSDVAISIVVDNELIPLSCDNPGATINGQTVTFPVVATLPAKQAIEYHIIAKGLTAGDAHTKFTLSSSNVTTPLFAEESTTVY